MPAQRSVASPAIGDAQLVLGTTSRSSIGARRDSQCMPGDREPRADRVRTALAAASTLSAPGGNARTSRTLSGSGLARRALGAVCVERGDGELIAAGREALALEAQARGLESSRGLRRSVSVTR